MRIVIQRVAKAQLSVEGDMAAFMGQGLVVLVGFAPEDGDKEMDYMLKKIFNLRVFEDEQGKMNLSVTDIDGGVMIVPNFTLYGDAHSGNRPGFSNGAPPSRARELFEWFMDKARALYPLDKLFFGVFQSHMTVNIVNDGPVTLLLDSNKTF